MSNQEIRIHLFGIKPNMLYIFSIPIDSKKLSHLNNGDNMYINWLVPSYY